MASRRYVEISESALRAEGGDAELADLGRQGPNDFFNGLLAPWPFDTTRGPRCGKAPPPAGRTRRYDLDCCSFSSASLAFTFGMTWAVYPWAITLPSGPMNVSVGIPVTP